MSRVLVTRRHLEDIAEAIRAKRGRTDTYTPGQMAAAIGQIHGDPVLQEKSTSHNGAIRPDAGYDGLSLVNVNVPDHPSLLDKNIGQNGVYEPSDDNVYGYGRLTVDVPNSYAAADEGKVVQNGALVAQTSRTVTTNGPVDTTTNDEVVVSVQPNLQSKTATQNGTVTADSGYDGLSSVIVNVSGGGGNVIISDQAPTADIGEVGQYYIWETTITGIIYGIRIQVAARDTQYGFTYWGARDIDFVFTDGTSEYHLRDFNNAACAFAIGENGSFTAENGTIDGTTGSYREHSGLPGYYRITAEVPTGLALSKVRICGRNDSTWKDFWRTFTIGQWTSDRTFINTLLAEEDLVLSDWDRSSQGAYTEFALDTPIIPTAVKSGKLYVKDENGWYLA